MVSRSLKACLAGMLALVATSAHDVRADEPVRLDDAPIEIEVSEEEADLEESGAPVMVVPLDDAASRTADLADVVGRASGVSVRRSGGLGSEARISLDGLEGTQIRYFLDGVPLELAGFPGGLALLPIDLSDRVEVHRGVVPVRLGSDALGGAIELVTAPPEDGFHARGSLSAGSFGTYRVAGSGSYRHTRGLFVRSGAYFDSAENDYPVHVRTGTDSGAIVPAVVHRFHDGYRGGGAIADVGLIERRNLDLLAFRVFGTTYAKEIQNNLTMTVPYGGASYGARTFGGSFRVAGRLHDAWRASALVGYARTRSRLLDVDPCAYDWYGRCLDTAQTPGELDGEPHDSLYLQDGGYARIAAEFEPAREHLLRFVIAPTLTTRVGEERRLANPELGDPLSGARLVTTSVNAIEYRALGVHERLEATVFGKHYLQYSRAEEIIATSDIREHSRTESRFGAGGTIRVRLREGLLVKSSYELATRLPSTDELFGDGRFVRASFGLRPETSHNVNASIRVESDVGRIGSLDAELSAFGRFVDDLIFLTGVEPNIRFKNIARARSVGTDLSLRYASPGEWGSLAATVTYQDLRNRSEQGDYAPFEGDRIPNRPWLFGTFEARFRAHGLIADGDELWLGATTRYVHEFYRAWESVGRRDTKQRIPTQVVVGATLSYGTHSRTGRITATLEVTNITDARAYDAFGVERPGRAAHARLAIER